MRNIIWTVDANTCELGNIVDAFVPKITVAPLEIIAEKATSFGADPEELQP